MPIDPPVSKLSRVYIFKLVWRGWFAGSLILLLPVWLLALLATVFTGAWNDLGSVAGSVVLIPPLAALLAVLVAGVVLLGIRLWREAP
jgi:hypothetical protein